MKKRRVLSLAMAIFLAISLSMTLISDIMPPVKAATTDEIETQLTAIGLTVEKSAGTVTVTGAAEHKGNIPLNIDPGVTVNWKATLTGNATLNNYLLTLSGSGTFNISDGGSIVLTSGAGGAMYINSGITLNVNAGGEISNPGSGSAVTISAGTQDAVINVKGGTISSLPQGYAINDGSGMTASTNNTKINISSGLVEAGGACAIRSTGISSVVNIDGGEVRNAASSNSNPVINMIYAPAPNNDLNNIIVSGGEVRTLNTDNLSFVLQTTQNVLINGGTVTAIAGRAINLIGDNSVARVVSGRVTTATGTAISTATSTLDEVTNAKIIISGGVVEATSSEGKGRAVVITGYNSTVEITGGQVLAKAGEAIDASGRPAADSVTVSGGFVFAWGSAVLGDDNVVYPAAKLKQPVGGVIAAWNTTTGIGPSPYKQMERDDLTMLPGNSVYWEKDPDGHKYFNGDGIHYSNGSLSGFFPLNVVVIGIRHTLTVYDGSGSPYYLSLNENDKVDINAIPGSPIITGVVPNLNPTNGSEFSEWTTNAGGSFASKSSASTVFTMPNNDVTITATYAPYYLLHVIGGTIDPAFRNFDGEGRYGYYKQGTAVGITTDKALVGVEWEESYSAGGSFMNSAAESTTYMMPGRDIMIKATGEIHLRPEREDFTTAIIGSSGTIVSKTFQGVTEPLNTDSYKADSGTRLAISARSPDIAQKEVFSHWEIIGGGRGFIENPYSPDTLFTVSDTDTSIEALFEKRSEEHRSFTLQIINLYGTAEKTCMAGDIVSIKADTPPKGKVFSEWVIMSGSGSFNGNRADTTFIMPNEDTTIKAAYSVINLDESPSPPPPPEPPDPPRRTDSTDPTDPPDPANPVDPPDLPDLPSLTGPDNTIDPIAPRDPSKPFEGIQPLPQPVVPISSDIPKTGDEENLIPQLSFILAATLGIIAIIVKLKKK